jgi:hypothetical protein
VGASADAAIRIPAIAAEGISALVDVVMVTVNWQTEG